MTRSLDWYRNRPSYTSITGLSAVRRLPRLGKIRLGVKATNAAGKEYPKDVDYFVCPPEVQAVYGEKPKVLDLVYLPCEDRNIFFPQSLKWYRGARLYCRGDGQTAMRINDQTGGMYSLSCPCEHLQDREVDGKIVKAECAPRASLMFLLPKVSMGGVYQLDTGSSAAMIGLNSSIDYLQNFLIGRIAFVPLRLKRVPTKMQTPGPEGKTVTKSIVTLEFAGNIEEVARLRQKDAIQQLIPGVPEEPAALPPAALDDEEEVDLQTGEIVPKGTGTTLPVMTFPDQTVEPSGESAPPEVDTGGEDPFPLEEKPRMDTAPDRQPGEDEDDGHQQQQQQPKEKSKPPTPASSEQDATYQGIANELEAAKNMEELNATWKDTVVANKSLSGMQKVDLQVVFMRVSRRLKGKSTPK
jgi:hypothetical protein